VNRVVAAVFFVTVPTVVAAQTLPSSQPLARQTVVVLPFHGRATQDRIDEAERVVRSVLLSQGARVPDAAVVRISMGVDEPRDARSMAGLGRMLSGTHVLAGEVQPFAGQYNLTLTVTEVASARVATQRINVGEGDAGTVIAQAIAVLFDPASLGPPPVDPEEERRRREEEQRRQEEIQRGVEEQRRQDDARRRAAEAERRRRWELEHPERRFDEGGAVGIGAGLQVGGHFSARPGASSTAVLLRMEGAYALRVVPGLELLAAVMFMTTPSTALGLGGGAQVTFPARSRGRFRGTGGMALGLFQGLSGAQLTTVWIAPFVRAEFHVVSRLAVFAGLALDAAPGDNGGLTALTGLLGLRLRVGGS
jgi:hypothetical protein